MTAAAPATCSTTPMSDNPRTDDIRTPRTVPEAEAAVEFALQVLANITRGFKEKEKAPSFAGQKEWEARARSAEKRWITKLAELRYLRERLAAGEAPEVEEIRLLTQKLTESERKNKVLVIENQRLRERLTQ